MWGCYIRSSVLRNAHETLFNQHMSLAVIVKPFSKNVHSFEQKKKSMVKIEIYRMSYNFSLHFLSRSPYYLQFVSNERSLKKMEQYGYNKPWSQPNLRHTENI